MRKFLRYSLTALVSVFMFYACQGSDPNIETAKLNLRNNDYQKALEAADAAIKQDSTSAIAYYYKGYTLSKIAQTKTNPSDRTSDYQGMMQAFDHAKKLFSKADKAPKEEMLMNLETERLWTNEHNNAIKLVSSDSTRTPANLNKAVAHLKNATIIEPDSVISYDVLAEVYNMKKNLPAAEQTLEKVIQIDPKSDVNTYLRLATFYNVDKKPKDAIELLKKAQKMYPDNVKIVQQLANSYLSLNDTQNAINAVQSLIENDPNNPQYRLVYGTELYKLVLDMNDKLKSNYDKIFSLKQDLNKTSNKSKKNELKAEINKLNASNNSMESDISDMTSKAEVQLKKTIELRPKDATAYHTLGVIYQNKAAALFQKRNSTEDNKQAAEYDKKAKEVLHECLPYYKKATDLEPNNKNYWQSLFKVYTTLGMNEKAAEAMKKAGLGN